MKNLLNFLLMVSMLVTVVLFAFGCDEQSTPPVGDTSSNKAAKVSLYDEEGNLLRTVTYTSQEDNTLDVSEFKRSGYKFVGVYDYATSSVRLFNANGYQSPSVLFDQDYKAVVKYEPISTCAERFGRRSKISTVF